MDYAFHAYNEVRQFINCLLSRSRVVSGLPQMDDWEAYMDPSKLKDLEKISSEDFLKSYEFGTELHRANTGELREFRNRCREFVDHLVDVILAQQVVSSDFFQGLYCFCPELLLEGDDRHVFQLFSRLLRVLERCGVIQSGVARTSLEEFTTFVVDARARHRDSGRSAEEISDIVSHLLGDYSFMSRRDLTRVLKICSLVVARPQISMPKIEIDLDRCAVPASVIMSSLRVVQSLVLSVNYKQGAFFTQGTMESVRDAIASSRQFMSSASFDPWESLCCGRSSFVTKYSSAFDDYLARKKKEADEQLHNANREPRHVRFSESGGSRTSSVCGSPRSVVKPVVSCTATSPGAIAASSSKTSGRRPIVEDSSLAAILERKKGVRSAAAESKVGAAKKSTDEGPSKGSKKDPKLGSKSSGEKSSVKSKSV